MVQWVRDPAGVPWLRGINAYSKRGKYLSGVRSRPIYAWGPGELPGRHMAWYRDEVNDPSYDGTGMRPHEARTVEEIGGWQGHL